MSAFAFPQNWFTIYSLGFQSFVIVVAVPANKASLNKTASDVFFHHYILNETSVYLCKWQVIDREYNA